MSDVFMLSVTQTATSNFYRGITLNGPAITIDGNSWQSSNSNPNFSYSNHIGVFEDTSVPLIPSTDANRTTMIRSSIWGLNPTVVASAIPNGVYDVFLYVWEDNFSETFSVALEGSVVVSNYVSGAAGTWSKLGPFRVSIADGDINISTSGGAANLSGIEIRSISTTNVAVTGISIPTSGTEVLVGKSVQVARTISPSNATNRSVTWSSSNTSVATVNNDGWVTGVSPGTATLTVSLAGFSAQTTVTVKKIPSSYSTRLTGTEHEKYGLAKSISVMPGDVITTEVYAKYVDSNPSNWNAVLTNLMATIANGTAPGGTLVDGGAAGSIGGGTFPFIGVLPRDGDNGTGPKAYLNYIVFDRNYKFKRGGFRRLTTSAKETGTDVPHERLAFDGVDKITVTEPGYVYIYLSNENDTPVEVYFDDFKVTHVKSAVVSSQEYYPFGLTFNSYSRENSAPQDYQYNGKERQDELNVEWVEYGARMFDPAIARWIAVDPATDLMKQYSPYVYSFDNPVRFVDRDGMIPEQVTTDPPDLTAITSGKQVDMSNAPARGHNAAGHPRNGPWFWKQMLEKYPQMFSKANAALIEGNKAPMIDDNWIDFNPSHAAYKGDKLIHHHVDQGHMATGIPEQVHRKQFSDLHTNTGGRRGGSGMLNKLGMFAGVLGLAFDIFSDDPHALGMQFSAGNKLQTLYYDMESDQYFEVTDRGTETDANGNEREYSTYNTYTSYRYNKETKKYEGVNKTGTYRAVRVRSLDEAYQYLYEQNEL